MSKTYNFHINFGNYSSDQKNFDIVAENNIVCFIQLLKNYEF